MWSLAGAGGWSFAGENGCNHWVVQIGMVSGYDKFKGACQHIPEIWVESGLHVEPSEIAVYC